MKLKPHKKSYEFSYTYGVFPTLDLLNKKPEKVKHIFIHTSGEHNDGVAQIKQLCNRKRIKFEYNNNLIDRLSAKENTYVLGVFDKYDSKIDKNSDHVVLVNPVDTGNLGTIIRTMLGFGMKNLAIIKPSVDVFDPKVVRSSMGSVFSINFEYFDTFDSYKNSFKNHNLYMFALDSKATLLPDAKFKSPTSFVFGNEGNGLDKNILKHGTVVKIPQSSDVDSFNLGVSVGIVLYTFFAGNH